MCQEMFAPLGKMCWTYFKTTGHSLNILSPSQKTLRPRRCPKLVAGLRKPSQLYTISARLLFDETFEQPDVFAVANCPVVECVLLHWFNAQPRGVVLTNEMWERRSHTK